ncbi:MAG: hypothetical protein ACRCZS_04655 [Chroococcidiopsis sp.]
MTNPQDRLTRVENLVEENARAINSLIQLATVQQQNIEVMQTEIRGIQLENRRLIERFFGTEENK